MNWLQHLWLFLSGKKTVLGTICLMASVVLSQVVVGIWEVNATWIAKAIETLDWTGLALGGTGLLHKMVKTKP